MEDIFNKISSYVPKALPTFVRNQYDADCNKILNLVEQRWQNAEISLMLTSVDKYLQYTVGENSQPTLKLIETLIPISKKLWFISMYNTINELKNSSNNFIILDPEMDHIKLIENRLTLKIRVRACKLLNTILESCMQLFPSIWEKDNKSTCQYFNSKFDFINIDVLLKAFEDYFRCDYTTRIAVSYTKRRCWITCVVRLSSLIRRIWLYRRDIGNYLIFYLFNNQNLSSHMYYISKQNFSNDSFNIDNFNFYDELDNQSGRCEIFYKFRILLLLCPNSTLYDLLLNRNLIRWWDLVNGDSVTSWNPMFFTFFFRAAKFAWANGTCVCNFFNDKIPIIFNILYNSFVLPNKTKVLKYKEVMPGEYACLLHKPLKFYKKASKFLMLILHPPKDYKSSSDDTHCLHNLGRMMTNHQYMLNSLNSKHMCFNNNTNGNNNANNENNNNTTKENTTNNNKDNNKEKQTKENNHRYDLFEYIKCLINVLYPYTHPSNSGKWSLSISLFVKYIIGSYSHRIIRERSMISGIYDQKHYCIELDNTVTSQLSNLKLVSDSNHNTNKDNITKNNKDNNNNTTKENKEKEKEYNNNVYTKLKSMAEFDYKMCDLVYGVCIQGMFSKNIQICNNYEETIKRICYICPQDYLEPTVSRMLDNCSIVNEPNQLLGSLRLFTQLSPLIVKYLPEVLPRMFQLLLQFISLSEPFMTTQSLILISLLLSFLNNNNNNKTNDDINKTKFLNGFGLGVFSSFLNNKETKHNNNKINDSNNSNNKKEDNNTNKENKDYNTNKQNQLNDSSFMCLKCTLDGNLFKCAVSKNLDFEYIKEHLSNNTCSYLEMVLFLENYCLCSRDSNPFFDSPVNTNKHKNRATTEEKASIVQMVSDVVRSTNLMIRECLNEWSILYFETILDLCSNSSKINLKGSSLMNTVEVSTFLLMRSSLLNLLNKVDEDTLVVLINKLLKFINNYSYKIEIVKYVISLLSCFSYVNSVLVLKQCFNTIEHNIATCFSNDTTLNNNNNKVNGTNSNLALKTNGFKKEVDNRLLWYLNCLASVIRFSNVNALKYKDRILKLLKTGLSHHSKQVFKLSSKILYRLCFSSFHLYILLDNDSANNNNKEYNYNEKQIKEKDNNELVSDLVNLDILSKLGVKWHYPTEDEFNAYNEFLLLMASQLNSLLAPFNSNNTMSTNGDNNNNNELRRNGKQFGDDDEISLFNRVNRMMILLKYMIKSVLLVDLDPFTKSPNELNNSSETKLTKDSCFQEYLLNQLKRQDLLSGNFVYMGVCDNGNSNNNNSKGDFRTVVEQYVIHVVLRVLNYTECSGLVVDNINEKITKLVNFMVSKEFYSSEVTATSMEALFNSLKKKVTINTSIISTKPMIKYLSFHYGVSNNSYFQDINELALVTLIQDFYYHVLNLKKMNPKTNHFSSIRTQYKKENYTADNSMITNGDNNTTNTKENKENDNSESEYNENSSCDSSSSDDHMDLDDHIDSEQRDIVEGIEQLRPYISCNNVNVGKELLDLLVEKMCLNNYENVSSNSQQVLKNVILIYGNTKYYIINSLLTHLNDLLNGVLDKTKNSNSQNTYNENNTMTTNGDNNGNEYIEIDNNTTKENSDDENINNTYKEKQMKEKDNNKENNNNKDKHLMLQQILENIVSFFDVSVLNYIVVNMNLLEKFFLFMMKVISLSNNKDVLMNKYDMLFIQFLNIRESPFNSDAYVNANYYSIDGNCSHYGTHGTDKFCETTSSDKLDECKVLKTDRYRKALKRILKKVGTYVTKHWRSRLYYCSLLLIYNNQLKSEQFFTNFHLEICRDSTNHYVLSLSLQGLLVVLETLNLSRSGRCLSGEPATIKEQVVVDLLDQQVIGRVFRTLVYSNHETIMNSANTGTTAGSTSTSTMAYNIVVSIIKFDRSWPRNRVPNNSNAISRHNFSLSYQYFKLIIHHRGIEAIDVVFDILNELSNTPQSYPENHISFIEIVGGLLKCSLELSDEDNHKLWAKLHPILKNEINNIVYDRILDYMDILRLVFEKLHRLSNEYVATHNAEQLESSSNEYCFKYIINFILNYEVMPTYYNYENVLLLENNKDDVTGYNLIIMKQLKFFISFLQEFKHASFTYILKFTHDDSSRSPFLSKMLKVLLVNLFNDSQKIRDEISFTVSYLLSTLTDKSITNSINDYVIKSLEPHEKDNIMEVDYKRVKGVLNLIQVLHNLSVPKVNFDNVELYLDFSLSHLSSDNLNVCGLANKCVFNIVNHFFNYDENFLFNLFKVLVKNVKNQNKVKLISITLLDVLYKNYPIYVRDSDMVGFLVNNYVKCLTDTSVREVSKNNLATIIITLNENSYELLTNVFIKSINEYNLKCSKNKIANERNNKENKEEKDKENKNNNSSLDDIVVGVYGLISLISTAPYHIPNWLPNVLVELARCGGSKYPLDIRNVVQKTLQEFFKNHVDAWEQIHSNKFTKEQLELLNTYKGCPIYFN